MLTKKSLFVKKFIKAGVRMGKFSLLMNRDIILKALSFLTSLGLAVASYFLTDTYKKMDDMRVDITQLQIKAEKIEENRFSVSDFVRAKEIIDSQIVATDKRVLILEEGQKTIKDYLFEIRSDIKEIKRDKGN